MKIYEPILGVYLVCNVFTDDAQLIKELNQVNIEATKYLPENFSRLQQRSVILDEKEGVEAAELEDDFLEDALSIVNILVLSSKERIRDFDLMEFENVIILGEHTHGQPRNKKMYFCSNVETLKSTVRLMVQIYINPSVIGCDIEDLSNVLKDSSNQLKDVIHFDNSESRPEKVNIISELSKLEGSVYSVILVCNHNSFGMYEVLTVTEYIEEVIGSDCNIVTASFNFKQPTSDFMTLIIS